MLVSCPLPPEGGFYTSDNQKVPFRGFRGNKERGALRQSLYFISLLFNLSTINYIFASTV
jgi:hypothetical protein